MYTAPLYTTRENLRPILDELNSPNFPTISFRISRERNKPFIEVRILNSFEILLLVFFFLFIMNITYTYYAIRGINELRKKLSKKKRKRKEDTIIS